jgi:F-type H+-transporting ATPase subunit delta
VIKDVAAKRYAEAAYLIAQQDGTEEAWSAGLQAMSALFGDEQGQAFMENTRISPADKLQLIEKSLEGVDPLVVNLARILLRRSRTSLGPQIAKAFQELVDEAKGVAHALVTSAVTLTDEDRSAVEKRLEELTGGSVVLELDVDESIIGGIIVRIGDRLIDGSTRSKLQGLKRELAGSR